MIDRLPVLATLSGSRAACQPDGHAARWSVCGPFTPPRHGERLRASNVGRMPGLTRLALLTLLATLAAAAPAAAQSAPPNEIVISEFRTRGPDGGNDEFVELRNGSTAPVEISGWRLQGCAAASPGNPSNRATVGSDTFLAPGGSYLFANDGAAGYSGTVEPDETYGTGFTDFAAGNFSGIRIVDTTNTVRDGVGSPNSPCREGTGILTPGTNGDNSFERLGGTTDTNNNLPDFQGPKPGNPQNSGGNTTGTPPITGLRIHDIQGRQHLSPYRGSFVVAVPGVVTARRFNGFYFQDPQPDDDVRTSEGHLRLHRRRPARGRGRRCAGARDRARRRVPRRLHAVLHAAGLPGGRLRRRRFREPVDDPDRPCRRSRPEGHRRDRRRPWWARAAASRPRR